MHEHEIFIVDDSQIQLILLEKVLTNQGFAIQSFTEGWELIAALNHTKPSLIISDIDMPTLNGFELLQEIKNRFERRIPFFFISSMSDSDTEKRARKAGAQGVIKKPFQDSMLLEAINNMLGLARA